MTIDIGLIPGGHALAGIPEPPRLLPGHFSLFPTNLGVLVYSGPGGISVDYYVQLASFVAKVHKFGKRAILHPGISWTCEAHSAITTDKLAPAWMKSMGIGPDQKDWLKSCDCGQSSLTIYGVLMGDVGRAWRGMGDFQGRPPSDVEDFGRCYRLLQRYPEWVARMGEVAERFPTWKPFVERWHAMIAHFANGRNEVVKANLDVAAAHMRAAGG